MKALTLAGRHDGHRRAFDRCSLVMSTAGVLETVQVEVEHEGVRVTEPLWRALQLVKRADRQAAILDGLDREVELRALVELHEAGARYGLTVPWRSGLLETIGPEARAWAIAQADAYPSGPPNPAAWLKQYIFRALVRSGVAIERRWEHLYPHVTGASLELLVECARGLPDERRAPVLAPHFSSMQCAAQLVAAFPTADMVTTLLTSVGVETPSGAALLGSMKKLGETNDTVREAVAAFLATLPEPLDLRLTSIVKPRRVEDLTPIAREQLRIAGKGYDQQDLDAAARLARNGGETSFHGSLELRTVGDAAGHARYDVLLYLADSGSIFEAGTTRELGGVSQGGVVLAEKNEPLRGALQAVVQAKKAARKKSTSRLR